MSTQISDFLSLESPEAKKMKALWERSESGRGIKSQVSFETMFGYFQSMNASEIAKKVAVSRQFVRIMYMKYFCTLFYGKTLATLNTERRLKKMQNLPAPARVHYVYEQARVAGHDVRASVGSKGCVRKGELCIDGNRCSVHISKGKSVTGSNAYPYFYFNISRISDVFDFIILVAHVRVKRIFIIPRSVLANVDYIYIPQSVYTGRNNVHPKINWLQYENAWNLITSKK